MGWYDVALYDNRLSIRWVSADSTTVYADDVVASFNTLKEAETFVKENENHSWVTGENEYSVQVLKDKTRWFFGSKLHREDGPALIYSNGTTNWYLNGVLHREGGPAIEWCDGGSEWLVNGKRHREDGPAVDYIDGYKEWWLDGVRYTQKEFNRKLNRS